MQLGRVGGPDHIPGIDLRRADEGVPLLLGGRLLRLLHKKAAAVCIEGKRDLTALLVQHGHIVPLGLPQNGPPAVNALGEIALRRRLGSLDLAVLSQLRAVHQHPLAGQRPNQHNVGVSAHQQLQAAQLPANLPVLLLADQGKDGQVVRSRLHNIAPVSRQSGGGLYH